ncbi:MAG: PHB depolymerase family esterase [Nocardiopsis sp. BM-2018]|uniref:Feruloyl esterase n=1 Tax=Nocardiopsis metallicus TaxID=179819 RepID=A0A840WCI8_9ACTN|nr:PHB depolymerase family esterase [Nocardiopsis metallicus]MBB5493882.1 feruloyl esterase [Nocardiopsis metallicus]QRN81192.1 MAG: PHB depolymerase family esterase [Nocardiopsis sp. BM-2018]
MHSPTHSPALRPLPVLLVLAAVLLLTAAALVVAAPRASAAELAPVPSFGADPGNLAMYEYVPDALPAGAPLVVLLHGCAQDAAAYHRHSGWAEQAEESGLALVYAEQSRANNATGCFNWFESGDVARGSGEAQSVASMVRHAVAEHGLDADRVYVSGLSAGGAMAAELLAAYPDLFAGGSIVAGIPVGCATSMVDAFICMNPGKTQTPEQWGDRVRAKLPDGAGLPRVAVWHGTSDTTVAPANGDASTAQWVNAWDLPTTPDSTVSLPGSTTAEYYGGGAGDAAVAYFSVSGMGHGTPVDPPAGCGTAGAYFLDTVCSTGYTAQFWGIGGPAGGEPTDPPTEEPTDPPTEEPTDPPTEEPTDPPAGECVTASNYAHVSDGRAEHRVGNAYALGSDDLLGLWNVAVTTSVTETVPGYWELTPGGC